MADPDSELRAVARDHARLDGLELYSRLGVLTGRSIDDPQQISDTIATIRSSLEATTSQQSTVYGWMTQALFEGFVASLGTVRLLKPEDSGGMYTAGDQKPPDFRIITADGERLLVEVKGAFQREPHDEYTIRAKDLDALQAYTDDLGGHRLMFAIYWVKWNLWTLTDAAAFSKASGTRSSLAMPTAFTRNELVELGDYMIGTDSPLTLTLYADASQRRQLDGDDLAFTVGDVQQKVAGKTITDPAEQRLAMYLMLYGRWGDRVEVDEHDGVVESVSFVSSPHPGEDERPETHGWLSSIYSTWFMHTTTNAEGGVVALRPTVKPSMLAALVPEPAESSVLKLWRFYVHPKDGSTASVVFPK